MAKLICKYFPKPINECISNPHVDIIKTRKDGKDTYIYEVSAKGVPAFVIDPDESVPAGNIPNLEDTWYGGQWPATEYNGCDYDLNLYDNSVYGETRGVGACIYSCVQQGDYPTTNFDDCVVATVQCWFQDEQGKRTEFDYNIPSIYLEKFGEWDGTPIPQMTEEKKNEFAKVLADNGLAYSFGWNKNNEFEVEIHDGDWKHDHNRLNCIMQNNGYELVAENLIGPPTDGDWYSAIHVFRKAEPRQATANSL